MNVYLLMLLLALATGLRTFTPLAAVLWRDQNWKSIVAALLALSELVVDKLPKTPGRTTPGPLLVRCVVGSAVAWFVGSPLGVNLALAICFGVAGAIAGAYIGYAWRTRLAPSIKLPSLVAALVEDAVAIGVAFWVVLGAH